MKLATKVVYNTIIQIGSKGISTVLGLAAMSIMARYLGTSGYGEYTTIITYLSFFAVFIDFGLTLITVQLISPLPDDAEGDRKQEDILSNLLTFRLLSAIVFLGMAPLIAWFFPYNESIKTGIAVSTLSFFFIALNQVFVGLFQKKLRMDKVSIAEVASRIVLVAGIFWAVSQDQGLMGIIWATIISSLSSFILHYAFSRRFSALHFRIDLSLWKDIMIKTWPLAITIIFNLIYLRTDTLILSLIRSQNEVGIYGAAYKVIDVLTTVPFMFAGIVLPIMTARWAARERDKFTDIMRRSLDLMIILALPMIAGAWILARPIMRLLAGPEFDPAAPVLKILIIACGLIFIGCIFSHAIIALDRQKQIIPAYIFTALTALAGYLIFIPRFSYYGAAWVTVYSEAAIAIAAAALVMKYSDYRFRSSILFKSILSTGAMSAILYASNIYLSSGLPALLRIVLLFFIGGASYFFFLILFRGVSRDDLAILSNKE